MTLKKIHVEFGEAIAAMEAALPRLDAYAPDWNFWSNCVDFGGDFIQVGINVMTPDLLMTASEMGSGFLGISFVGNGWEDLKDINNKYYELMGW